MKRILSLLLCGFAVFVNAQHMPAVVSKKTNINSLCSDGNSVHFTQQFIDLQQQIRSKSSGGSARAVSTVPVGTAGNLYTILNGNVNRIAVNNDLGSGTIVFIHRSNPDIHGTGTDAPNELARYRYDISYDGGSTWQLDYGVLNPSGNQQTRAGRYPNVVIYNPPANTNLSNAYLAYLGTWLPFDPTPGTWDGLFTGVARLDNNTGTFTQNVSIVNDSNIFISMSLCNAAPGKFWAVNFGSQGTGTNEDIKNVLLFKGTWNSGSHDVNWILADTITPPYDRATSTVTQSGNLSIAFDPTGKYGWLGMMADVIDSSRSSLSPVFYSSSDSGSTWTGPVIIDLETFPNVVAGMYASALYPTCTSDGDLAVDVNGNPHWFGVVGGAASDSTIYRFDLKLYDFYYNSANNPPWQAVFISGLQSFRGDVAADDQGQPITEFNRPQAVVSPDGEKVFVTWLDSDTSITLGTNEIPDFYTRGYDVTTGLATPVVNWTAGDSRWEGQALFASTSPNTFGPTGTYRIPTIFAELDASQLGTDPVQFHYVQNIQYTENQFTEDILCPRAVITLNGDDPQYVYLGDIYSDPGANAETVSCQGDSTPITGSVLSNAGSSVHPGSRGEDTVTYSYADGNGANAISKRRVIINTEPEARFVFTVLASGRVNFVDSSLYSPTSWLWDFGYLGNSQTAQNPHYTYPVGTYNVCLKAKNNYNDPPFSKTIDQICKDVTVTSVNTGIADAGIENSFHVYPNPSSGVFMVEITGNFENANLKVMDVVGKEFQHVEFGKVNAGIKHSLDISANPDGIYFIKIQTEKGTVMRRAMVSR